MTTDTPKPQLPVRAVHGQKLSLDQGSLDNIVAAYPEEVRDDVIWLGGFVRDHCNRNLAVLESRVAKLGFDTSYSTFHKVFTGRYFIVAERGSQAGKFIGNIDNFRQVVDALRRDERLALTTARVPFVETGTWHQIRDYIDTKRMPEQVCRFGVIVGSTGSQKSACLKEYALRNNHGTCVHLESPHNGIMSQFVTDLAARYGCPIWEKQPKKLLTIASAVNDRRSIIIDNTQRLYQNAKENNQPVFNFLQKLQDDTGCTIILCFTPEFKKTLQESVAKGYFEQFVGRAGGRSEFLELPENAPREDVLQIANAFGLHDARTHIAELERISREPGRIRILFNALQKGRRLADAVQEQFCIEHVREVRDEKPAAL